LYTKVDSKAIVAPIAGETVVEDVQPQQQ
jgi:hypothetical protein